MAGRGVYWVRTLRYVLRGKSFAFIIKPYDVLNVMGHARDSGTGTGDARPLLTFNLGQVASQVGRGSRRPPCRVLLPDVLLLSYMLLLLLLRCFWPTVLAAVLILLLLLKLVVVVLLLLLLLQLLLRKLLILVVVLLLVLLLLVLLLLRCLLCRVLCVLRIRRVLRVRRVRIAVRSGGVIPSVRVAIRASGRVVPSVRVRRRRCIRPVALRGRGQAAWTHAAGRVVSRGGVVPSGQARRAAAAAAAAAARA